jgi:hypothetical protein
MICNKIYALVKSCHWLRPGWLMASDVACIVSARREDERHAVYESLRRMTAAAGPGKAGQSQPGPPAARSLVVLDTVAAAAGPPAAAPGAPAGGVGRGGAAVAGQAGAPAPRANDAAGHARPGTLAGSDCSRVFEATILVYVGGRDSVRASVLVDQVSGFFRESHYTNYINYIAGSCRSRNPRSRLAGKR